MLASNFIGKWGERIRSSEFLPLLEKREVPGIVLEVPLIEEHQSPMKNRAHPLSPNTSPRCPIPALLFTGEDNLKFLILVQQRGAWQLADLRRANKRSAPAPPVLPDPAAHHPLLLTKKC